MTEERLKLHEKAETRINAIIDTLSQDKGGLANKLKQEDVKDFLVSLWVDCSTEATKELEKENAELEDKLANADYQLEGRDNEIRELKKKNKVLAQNLEDTEIINAELKQKYDTCLRENTGLKIHNAYVEKKLTEAKVAFKYLLSFIQKENYKTRWDINIVEAEQFLKNDSCSDVMCEDCTKEDCGIKKLGLVEVEK